MKPIARWIGFCIGLQRIREYHSAVEVYKTLLDTSPQHAVGWFNLGKWSTTFHLSVLGKVLTAADADGHTMRRCVVVRSITIAPQPPHMKHLGSSIVQAGATSRRSLPTLGFGKHSTATEMY